MTSAASSEPSTAWRELIAPDEDERFARQAESITQVQRTMGAKYGVGRTLHRNQRLGLTAELTVLDGLPEHAAHGLFARPGAHRVLVRMSSGGMRVAPDSTPDIRGFAISVLDVAGPGALGSDTATQDFLLINQPAFGLPNSTEFVDLISADARGRLALVGHAIGAHGFGALSFLKGVDATLRRPFGGFATETFWSAAPIANGPYAVRVRLLPVEPGAPATGRDWVGDVSSRLASGALNYELQLQFFTDESVTPIEDPSVDWPTPYLTVARLTIPSQDPTSADGAAVQARTEAGTFDPWSALVEHRPLGEIMRARRVAYRASQLGRGAS